jgi:hypothetical protein
MKLLLVIFVAFFFSGCRVAEELVLRKQGRSMLTTKLANSLKINGYFYSPYEDGYCAFFLFENGNYFDEGALLGISDLNELDSIIVKVEQSQYTKNLYYRWGIYRLEGSTILINRWLPGVGGPYPTQLLKGEILNDTTIKIAGLTENGTTNRIDTFHFRQFSPKPDSTTQFIEGS